MHNCKRTKEELFDLTFEELSSEQRTKLKSDLNKCAACRAEYASLAEMLGAVDHAFAELAPAEGFWTGYEARLGQRLNQVAVEQKSSAQGTSFVNKLKGIFLFPVRVPASVAAMFLLLFALATVLAVRSQQSAVPQPPIQHVVETRNVEVPVYKDREVTRVVYVDRTRQRSRSRKQSPDPVENFASTSTPASLAGFRPIDEVKLTVIKGTESNEK